MSFVKKALALLTVIFVLWARQEAARRQAAILEAARQEVETLEMDR